MPDFSGAFTSGLPFISSLGFFNDMPPDVANNWFQHPWTLGIPLGLTLFLMLTNLDAEKKTNPLSLLAIMVVTTVLGMAQTALYGIFVISVLGWAAITWLIAMARDAGGTSQNDLVISSMSYMRSLQERLFPLLFPIPLHSL